MIVTAQGRALRVEVRDGSTTPLLICNGIGGSLELLQPFVDALDPRRAVIRFDLPGIGGSPPPTMPYHLLTLPGMLAGLLDRLGYNRADVLGVSWGGGLAQQFALTYPRRVRKLVLVATGTGMLMVPGRPRVLRHMLTPQRYRDADYAAAAAPNIYGGSLRDHPERVKELLHASARVGPRRGYYYQLLAGAGWTSLPMLPFLRQPTLLMAGDDDPIIPMVNARLMAALIPRSQIFPYQGGHLELIAEPMRLAPAVESFLKDGKL
jgi:poly(3-hydroxyalkanoate) depolymerase